MQLSARNSADRHGNALGRTAVEAVDDTKAMQESTHSLFTNEQQAQIEHVHPYGFTNVPKKPTGQGAMRRAAEAFMSYMGAGRSHGIAMVVGDRRFRLYKLQEGEVALYDDQGHQIHLTRNGIVTSAPNSKVVAHQVMQSDDKPSDGPMAQTAQKDQPVVAKAKQSKDEHNVSHTQTINHNVTQAISQAATAAQNIASQMQGIVAQAQALVSGGVGLPGLNAIGSQLQALAGSVTGTGASVAASISSLAASMSSGSMAGMSSLLSSMSPLVSQLQGLLNPGNLPQAIHQHVMSIANGIVASAFNGQHTTTWDNHGVTHSSSAAVSSTAPQLPHNGTILGSDTMILTKVMTAASYGTSSDARLKTNVEDFPAVLDRGMQIRIKTFLKKYIATDAAGVSTIHDDDPVQTFGVIAQDFELLFPEMVGETNGFKHVDEPKFGIIAIAMLQEFITEQREEIAQLKAQLAAKV
jgi:phage gp45-like